MVAAPIYCNDVKGRYIYTERSDQMEHNSVVITEEDKKYMRRAIELAKLGTGAVNPNPLVGAVIVKDGRIIGEGYHRKYGELHAEREAIAHLTEDAEGADMYVTLEPCCHYGKQPPCALAVIEHKIKRVFVGSDDPNKLVSGGGYKLLRDAGIEVITHVLKDECDGINDVFFHYIVNKKSCYFLVIHCFMEHGEERTYQQVALMILLIQ